MPALRRSRAARILLPLLLPALLGPACRRAEPVPARPNVLLVSIDTLRADHLSAHGYHRPTSPHLDRLAEEGVLFESCVSPTSWTLPAHLTMLTGLPISAHGICDDRLWTLPGADGRPAEVEMHGVFVSEVLRGAGYRTAGFYTWKYLEPRFGFGPGFEVYERLGHTFYSYEPVASEFERLRNEGDVEGLKRLAAEHPELFDSDRPSTPETVDRALAWIDGVRAETPGAPFFCFLHLFDVHDPYRPPPPFDALFTDPSYDGPIDGRNVTAPNSPVHAGMARRDLEQLVALYDGGIAWVDSEFGRLLDQLEARGLARDTLVIVTSDHGEEFFEHGNKTHRNALYEESVHVPFLMRWPRGLPAGRRVPGRVGLVDLAPTLAALCDLPPPPGATGRDLSAVARGARELDPAAYLTELHVFDEGAVPRRIVGLHAKGESAILSARGRDPFEVERHDLAADPRQRGPGERFALDSPRGADIAELFAELRREARAARARTPRRPAGDGGPLDASELAELASMGYAGTRDAGPARAVDHDGGRLCIDGCHFPDGD